MCVSQSSPNNRGGALSDAEALSQITKGHDTMCVMLSSRHKNLETVRAVWAREDIKVKWRSQSQSSCDLCHRFLRDILDLFLLSRESFPVRTD